MTGAASRIVDGPLPPGQAALVLELAEAAGQADGVAPLSEHVLLHVRHGSAERSRDLLLYARDADSGEQGGEGGKGGKGEQGRETAAGYAHLDPAGEEGPGAGDMSGELVVHPAHRRRGHGTALIAALAAGADGHGIRLWAHGDLPGAAALARSAGFTRFRALWQMRMSLAGAAVASPVLPAGITLRTFRPGHDEEAWLRVNRRAFADHPEQGSWTRQDLELRETEPWFDPDGFFLAERDGALAGFHWTKVHEAEHGGAPIGEVYVVGVDPAEQGGGLGRALTLAGLAHLQHRGLAEVMLYVDESNAAAIRMYTTLGLRRWSTDVMYRRAQEAQPQTRRTPSTASSSVGESGPSLAATALSTSA